MGMADLASADDAELVVALRHDPAALEEFYRRHVRPLTRYLTRRVGDPELAADLVASTFVAAMESASGYDPARGEAAAWLYGIAGNVAAAHQRRAIAEARALTRMVGRRPIRTDGFDDTEARVDAQRRIGPVETALNTLPKGERDLVALIAGTGLTVTEAASELGIRPGAARMRLARARQRLQLGEER